MTRSTRPAVAPVHALGIPPTTARLSPLDGGLGSADLTTSLERASLLTLSLHELLVAAGRPELARIAWTVYLETSMAAERVGEALGLNVDVA